MLIPAETRGCLFFYVFMLIAFRFEGLLSKWLAICKLTVDAFGVCLTFKLYVYTPTCWMLFEKAVNHKATLKYYKKTHQYCTVNILCFSRAYIWIDVMTKEWRITCRRATISQKFIRSPEQFFAQTTSILQICSCEMHFSYKIYLESCH